MSGNPLALRFPTLAGTLPWLSLGELPTPLQDLPALATRLGVGTLAVKRDDLSSPAYGGNKLRKLEFLLADALATGCETVVTFGSVGSNHALATSVFAARLGLLPQVVLIDQPPSPAVARKLRHLLQLDTRIHAADSFAHARQVAERIRDTYHGGADRVCELPWGGSNWRGAIGFIAAAFELERQIDQSGEPPPDFLYVCGGTLGTAIGLALGLRAAGLPTRIVAPRAVGSRANEIAHVTTQLVEVNREVHVRDASFPLFTGPMVNLELRPEFYGPGYAEPTAEAVAAIGIMQTQGIDLEITYTAKAFAGLVADARSGRLAGRRVVFWNTYSSAPCPAGLDRVDLTGLPPGFRHYLEPAPPTA